MRQENAGFQSSECTKDVGVQLPQGILRHSLVQCPGLQQTVCPAVANYTTDLESVCWTFCMINIKQNVSFKKKVMYIIDQSYWRNCWWRLGQNCRTTQPAAGVTFGPYIEWNDGIIEVSLILLCTSNYVVFDWPLEPGCFHCFRTDPRGSIDIQHFQVVAGVTFGYYNEENKCEMTVSLL